VEKPTHAGEESDRCSPLKLTARALSIFNEVPLHVLFLNLPASFSYAWTHAMELRVHAIASFFTALESLLEDGRVLLRLVRGLRRRPSVPLCL
jgi:hypothetical protein